MEEVRRVTEGRGGSNTKLTQLTVLPEHNFGDRKRSGGGGRGEGKEESGRCYRLVQVWGNDDLATKAETVNSKRSKQYLQDCDYVHAELTLPLPSRVSMLTSVLHYWSRRYLYISITSCWCVPDSLIPSQRMN